MLAAGGGSIVASAFDATPGGTGPAGLVPKGDAALDSAAADPFSARRGRLRALPVAGDLIIHRARIGRRMLLQRIYHLVTERDGPSGRYRRETVEGQLHLEHTVGRVPDGIEVGDRPEVDPHGRFTVFDVPDAQGRSGQDEERVLALGFAVGGTRCGVGVP